MWGGNAIARKWGAIGNVAINDGLHQNNHIAIFPDFIRGAAAQFDLWNHSYSGTSLRAAIHRWCGGNSSEKYIMFLERHTGLIGASVVTRFTLSQPVGIRLMKAQAQWEAGKPYPMSEQEWEKAQELVFPKPLPESTPNVS